MDTSFPGHHSFTLTAKGSPTSTVYLQTVITTFDVYLYNYSGFASPGDKVYILNDDTVTYSVTPIQLAGASCDFTYSANS